MSVLNRIAYDQNRRDEALNQVLAGDLVKRDDHFVICKSVA